MSKITLIQQRLKSIGDGGFQKLCDAYLYKLGYKSLWAIGSVTGANKTKTGHPDTLVSTPDGTYVLVEATTMQAGLIAKLKGDLDSCFDEGKTGIRLEKIEEIILCFNSNIVGAEQEELVAKAQEKGCKLSLHGITKISFALYQDYPQLAREFLDVSVCHRPPESGHPCPP